jgi:hypothetical protein
LIALCNPPTRQPPGFSRIELGARVDETWIVEAGELPWRGRDIGRLSRLPSFGRRNQSPSVGNGLPAAGDFRRGSSGVLR